MEFCRQPNSNNWFALLTPATFSFLSRTATARSETMLPSIHFFLSLSRHFYDFGAVRAYLLQIFRRRDEFCREFDLMRLSQFSRCVRVDSVVGIRVGTFRRITFGALPENNFCCHTQAESQPESTENVQQHLKFLKCYVHLGVQFEERQRKTYHPMSLVFFGMRVSGGSTHPRW